MSENTTEVAIGTLLLISNDYIDMFRKKQMTTGFFLGDLVRVVDVDQLGRVRAKLIKRYEDSIVSITAWIPRKVAVKMAISAQGLDTEND